MSSDAERDVIRAAQAWRGDRNAPLNLTPTREQVLALIEAVDALAVAVDSTPTPGYDWTDGKGGETYGHR